MKEKMVLSFIFNIGVFTACCVALAAATTLKTFPIPSGGSESFVFGASGELYTGVNCGSILKFARSNLTRFSIFAHASPNWTLAQCAGRNDPYLGFICGRTLGLGLHNKTGQLYLADAYHGLSVVKLKRGGLATNLLTSVAGLPLKWLDGMDVDQKTGYVYFTDVSTRFNFSEVAKHLATRDSTGRVIEYNPNTKKARVLLTGLSGAGGVGCSKDGAFIIISELIAGRITKYWLKGPKANTHQVVLNTTFPANVKRTESGHFWIAINVNNVGAGIKIDENGKILKQISFGKQYNGTFIQEVHEHCGKLYISSLQLAYAGIYDLGKASGMTTKHLALYPSQKIRRKHG